MSNIYINEPTTHGKVLLQTTFGDVDIELWSKECPLACRNFVQLCLENYYNGTIFHRIVKNFIAQGGDPTGTGLGGDSIYGKPFKDEFHQRLRFIRPGLVAMANSELNDNGSQFFFTLGATPELQNKHTIIGKVSGDTKFNLLKLNEIQTDKNERPYQPPKIKKTIILSNPFPDIVPRLTSQEEAKLKEEEQRETANKILSTKSFNLLSFGDEAEEDEYEITTITKTTNKSSKSMHDLVDDPLFLKKPVMEKFDEANDNLDFQIRHLDNDINDSKKQLFKNKLENLKNDLSISLNSSNHKLTQQNDSPIHELDKNDDEAEEPQTEFAKNALYEYVDSNKLYKERKKQLPKNGSRREQQTLNLLTTFREKLQNERQVMIRNAKLKPLSGGDGVTFADDIPALKPRHGLTKREKFEKMQEALRNPEHLTEQYPELRLWEDKEYDELEQEMHMRELSQNDDKDPDIKELLTHQFVCSDVSDLSDEADNYPVHKIKKHGTGKKKKSQLQRQPGQTGLLGDETSTEDDDETIPTADQSSETGRKSEGDEEEVDANYYILKKTTKDACSINPQEYYDIYDPRNPINVRRREGDSSTQNSSFNSSNLYGIKKRGAVVDTNYNPLDPNYSANVILEMNPPPPRSRTLEGDDNVRDATSSQGVHKFFASSQEPKTVAGVKKYHGPTTDHAKNLKEFLKSRSTFNRKN